MSCENHTEKFSQIKYLPSSLQHSIRLFTGQLAQAAQTIALLHCVAVLQGSRS